MTDRIEKIIQKLDTTNLQVADKTWQKIKPDAIKLMPIFRKLYPTFQKWQGRTHLLFHSIKFARNSEDAFQLGLMACNDKSRIVRYRACGLLAYSLRNDALPILQKLIKHKDKETINHAKAAIDAIKNQNHHYFIDRKHSGKSFWHVK